MRSTRALHWASALALGLAVAGLTPLAADAGGRFQDHIHADSFGNLVIHSHAGYKRIVVGAGHLAAEMARHERVREKDVVYLEDLGPGLVRECYRPPVFLKGRSYMYGLVDGEMPDLWGGCH